MPAAHSTNMYNTLLKIKQDNQEFKAKRDFKKEKKKQTQIPSVHQWRQETKTFRKQPKINKGY